jgi:hypothetical protein
MSRPELLVDPGRGGMIRWDGEEKRPTGNQLTSSSVRIIS